MSKPVIPTLTPGVGLITEKDDIVAYVIRHVLSTPGKSTDIYASRVFSFSELESLYGEDPDTLASKLQQALSNIFNYYFTDRDSVTVSVIVATIPNSDKYNLEIRVTDTLGTNILTITKIEVSSDHIFKIYYN